MAKPKAKNKSVLESSMDGYKIMGHALYKGVETMGRGFTWIKDWKLKK